MLERDNPSQNQLIKDGDVQRLLSTIIRVFTLQYGILSQQVSIYLMVITKRFP